MSPAKDAAPRPWSWEVHDYSAATLKGPREEDHVLTLGPCDACAKREHDKAKEEGRPPMWKPGRCTTPTAADMDLIVRAVNLHDELVEALRECVAALEGVEEGLGGPVGMVHDILSDSRAVLAKAEAAQ